MCFAVHIKRHPRYQKDPCWWNMVCWTMTSNRTPSVKGKMHWCCKQQQSLSLGVNEVTFFKHIFRASLPDYCGYLYFHQFTPHSPAPSSAKMPAKEMEIAGIIDQGSMARLRREAKAAQSHSLKAVQMLANALSPVVGLDQFSPRTASPAHTPELDDLTRKPVLIVCADEERKQFLGKLLPLSDIRFHFHSYSQNFWLAHGYTKLKENTYLVACSLSCHPRVKWINQLAYVLRLRMWRKQDFHHRSFNDAKTAIQHCGLWGPVFES